MFGIRVAEFDGGCIFMYVKNCCRHLRSSASVTGLINFTFSVAPGTDTSLLAN